MRNIACLVSFAALMSVAACGAKKAEGTSTTAAPRADSRRITAAELANASQTNLLQYVQAHRPQWFENARTTGLSGRTSTVAVYLDGQRFGDADQLRNLTLSGVKEVRFYSVSEAQQRFNVKDLESVINVVTK